MKIRKYDSEKDSKAVFRILKECGWVEKEENVFITQHIKKGRSVVATMREETEAMAVSTIGDMQYLNSVLPFSAVTAVTVSLMARKRGLASRLTAQKIAEDARDGAAVCGLSIFDQGYYNQLGFGNGSYQHYVEVSPASIKLDRKTSIPIRLTAKDWKQMHRCRTNRMRFHGSVNLTEICTMADLNERMDGMGFGFLDEQNQLTHYVWFFGKGKEEGPFWINQLVYQTYDQLLELLTFISNFDDQVKLVKLVEPPHFQIQDLLEKPFFYRRITANSTFRNIIRASAWWQIRILDLQRCVELMKTQESISFNLKLTDPIVKYLPDDAEWKGLTGEYCIHLDQSNSSISTGFQPNLPIMTASINAFSRWWLGVQPATSLSVTDSLQAGKALLEKLDQSILIPKPYLDWEF